MKKSEVIKNHTGQISPEDMEKINRYTRRIYTSDEVYVFSVKLCDNDIDRDFERFTVEALFQMEKLFVGKTGILDHQASANNQRARIFDCRVVAQEDRKTLTGDDYFALVGRAYMPKNAENEPLIERIESGICKEISVGVSAAKRVCSVCCAEGPCSHIPGEEYAGKVCYRELSEVADAYEWSFVAVPAQREAGVMKHHSNHRGKEKITMNEIMKKLKAGEGNSLSSQELVSVEAYIRRLEKKAEDADAFREELEAEVLRYSALAQPEISAKTMANAIKGLSVKELREFASVFRKKAEPLCKEAPVLSRKASDRTKDNNKEFRI